VKRDYQILAEQYEYERMANFSLSKEHEATLRELELMKQMYRKSEEQRESLQIQNIKLMNDVLETVGNFKKAVPKPNDFVLEQIQLAFEAEKSGGRLFERFKSSFSRKVPK
jgi:hypothetical protein